MVMRKGSGQATLDGSADLIPLKAGQMVVVSPYAGCGVMPDGVVELTMVFVSADYLVEQIARQHPRVVFDHASTHKVVECLLQEPFLVLTLPEEEVPAVYDSLDALVRLTASGSILEDFSRAQYEVMGVLLVVMGLLAHQQSDDLARCGIAVRPCVPGMGRVVALSTTVREALVWIRTRYAESWTLDDLADHVGMGQRGLTKAFQGQIGRTPLMMRDRLRVSEMANLLANTALSVPQIAQAVGWSCPNHAADRFEKVEGVTPAKWRNQVRNPA